MSIVKLNNNGVKNATAFGSITGLGSMTFIKKLTASSSSTLSFVDGASSVVLDNTYKEYLFTFNNIHPATDNVTFNFNVSIDGGSNYNVAKTTTNFRAYHYEDGSGAAVDYRTTADLAQGTGSQILTEGLGNANDECVVGVLRLFNPSSTTFVKHFMANSHAMVDDGGLQNTNFFVAGYCNTTTAIDGVQFKFDSGNIDSGTFKLYGVS